MKYDVITFGDEVLRRKAVRVTRFDAALRRLASDMLQTMYESNGVGLAAEQIGREECLCVIDAPASLQAKQETPTTCDHAMPLIMVNPRITSATGVQVGQEGCLSFPEVFVNIRRAQDVTAVFDDLAGKEQTVRASGLVARAIQHEVDHLNGILLVDRMTAVQRVAVAGKLKRLKKAPVHCLREVLAASAL